MLATFNRSDTLLGVCEALGQDLGFNPLWLRVALSVGVLWNPVAMIAAYLALGMVVAVARLVAPTPKRDAPTTAIVETAANDEVVELKRAA